MATHLRKPNGGLQQNDEIAFAEVGLPALRRLAKRPRPRFSKVLLPVIALLSGLLLGLVLPELTNASSFWDYGKCIIAAVSATFTAYAVNRFALEKGAFQAAIGSPVAAIVSIFSVLLVGTGLFTATYAGFVREDTDRLRLQEFATAQSAWLERETRAANGTYSGNLILNAIMADLEKKVTCEAASSCVSGVGAGGEGSAFDKLSGALASARAIAAQVDTVTAARGNALQELGDLQASIHGALVDGSLSAAERRLQTEEIAQTSLAVLNRVQQSSPLALLASFAGRLKEYDGSRHEDQLLASYGAQLAAAVSETKDLDRSPPPAFPAPTGVADTLGYVLHFLPIALLILVIELILPMTLWLYTFVELRARLERQEQAQAAETSDRSDDHNDQDRAEPGTQRMRGFRSSFPQGQGPQS